MSDFLTLFARSGNLVTPCFYMYTGRSVFMISPKTNYLQQTVEIGNPIPEAQLKPPHDVAGMTSQGPP